MQLPEPSITRQLRRLPKAIAKHAPLLMLGSHNGNESSKDFRNERSELYLTHHHFLATIHPYYVMYEGS